MENVQNLINQSVNELFNMQVEFAVDRTQPQFGDFASNISFKLAGRLGQKPIDIAGRIADKINSAKPDWLCGVDVAGAGYINFRFSDSYIIGELKSIYDGGDEAGKNDVYANQNILVEYLDPNPFKELHIGHAYSGTVGDAISNLFAIGGGKVHRVTYQGDVGLHVAKAIYGLQKMQKGSPEVLELVDVSERPKLLGEAYALGSTDFDKDEEAKAQIYDLNNRLYQGETDQLKAVYDIGKSWSLEYFDKVYKEYALTPFEKNYMESAVAEEGISLVRQHLDDGIFKQSDGAIIFEGEPFGLHTRVFVTSQGIPTYEAKDLGNAMLKWRDYQYDRSIVITGNEQAEYFKVMLKALEQFAPEQAKATTHITHGMVRLPSGKMSSRTGDVIKAVDLLNDVRELANNMASGENAPINDNALAAIKYAFLKNRIGGDIVYDAKESLSIEGNSGPYLQYAHARARSILAKVSLSEFDIEELQGDERSLASKLIEYKEVVENACVELAPHLVCTYLYETAQQFNRFYENNRVIDDARQAIRLSLIAAYAQVLRNGLTILNIPSPDKM